MVRNKEEKEMVVSVNQAETELTIVLPIVKPLKLSKSEKSLVVATTHGNTPTKAVVNNKPLIVGVNAYIKKD